MQINIAEYWLDHIGDEDFRKKVAVVDGERNVAFGEIFDRAGFLGEWLIENIAVKRTPIAVYLPKSPEQIAVDIAIIYSGNAYMNIDVKQPVGRTEAIVDHIRPACVLTEKKFGRVFGGLNLDGTKVIFVDELQTTAYDFGVIDERLRGVTDCDPLCVINTSGSTGTPKGVVLNHRSTIDFIDQATKVLPLDDCGVIGSLSPVHFDIFTLEIYMTLWKGWQFVIIPDHLAAFPERLVESLERHAVDFIFWVPTVMVNIANLDILSTHKLSSLRTIFFAGEVFPQKHLAYWIEHLPSATFVNMYGPIEITVDCLYHVVTSRDIEDQSLPIGKTFPNTTVYILNDGDQECALGRRGRNDFTRCGSYRGSRFVRMD